MLTRRQLATVLAALRLWQQSQISRRSHEAHWHIATDCGRLKPLAPSEIDALCERFNQPDSDANARYVLYDFDADELATTLTYNSHADAARDADQLNNVAIIKLPIGISTPDEYELANDDELGI